MYRIVKRIPVKVCAKHEDFMCKKKMGSCIKLTQLSQDEIQILEEKQGEFNFMCPICGNQRSVACNEILEDNVPVRCLKCKTIMNKI